MARAMPAIPLIRHFQGASINFQGGASPYAPYNMESLIMKNTCLYSLF